MTHNIELTVTCDQAELDRLVRYIAEWTGGIHARNAAANAAPSGMRKPMQVHKFWVDGKPMWSGEPPV